MSQNNKVELVSAPMSFAGSLGRTLNALWIGKPIVYQATVGWLIVGAVIMYWWVLIFCWYCLFGILLVPYRLVRRSGRKQKIENRKRAEQYEVEERRHKEIIETLKNRE